MGIIVNFKFERIFLRRDATCHNLTSKRIFPGKVTKIEYGNIDFEKVIIETVTSTRR